jgi:hypothetical protein
VRFPSAADVQWQLGLAAYLWRVSLKVLTDWNYQGSEGVSSNNSTVVHDILWSHRSEQDGEDREEMAAKTYANSL